jgi:hypothetical protein
MSERADPLPDPIETLRALVRSALAERDAALAERDTALAERDRMADQNDRLRHLLRELQRVAAARKSSTPTSCFLPWKTSSRRWRAVTPKTRSSMGR